MGIEIIKIDIDQDLNGISIARKVFTEVSGVTYYTDIERAAFRKQTINEDSTITIDTEFYNKVDAWTGVDNFIATRFNF